MVKQLFVHSIIEENFGINFDLDITPKGIFRADWSLSDIENCMRKRDLKSQTKYLESYNNLSNEKKVQFAKYFILLEYGGVFLNDDSTSEENIIDTYKYCTSRDISIFESPSLVFCRQKLHPSLMSILTNESFKTLSDTLNPEHHYTSDKTVITNLLISEYLPTVKKYNGTLGYLLSGVIGFLLGGLVVKLM